MNEENTNKLTETFPNLYPPYRPLYQRGPNNTQFSFECGDGWYQMLYDLSAKLDPLCKIQRAKAALVKIASVGDTQEDEVWHQNKWSQATQVKEKFGTLRFYMSSATEEMHELIREAEAQSCTTCEVCGAIGRTQGKGWLETLCDDHAAPKIEPQLNKEQS